MRKITKKILQSVGVELQRTNLYSRNDLRLNKFLEVHNIDTVLDVGANKGQFALELLHSGFKGQVISFEALPDVYSELQERSEKFGERWIIAPRCALSDEKGSVEFHITRDNTSSSMLRPAEESEGIPHIFSVSETIKVDCTSLDLIVKEMEITSTNIFLKLDVQGGEEKVLKGIGHVMSQIKGLIVEMPLRRYYENQQLAREMDTGIIKQGFELWDILPAFRHPETGRLDYIDCVYFRKS